MNPWHYIAEGNVTIGILLYCLLSLSFLPFIRAEESADYSDAEIAYDSPATGSSHSAAGLAKNARFAFDFSTRVTYHDELDQWAYRQALGIDYIKTFSSANGDWGTLIAQLYLTRIDNYRSHPYFFEGGDDWELVFRNTNFNFTGIGGGRLNFRIGHFELPYGLEVAVNTNGTIRQLQTAANLGIKGDWGLGINGVLPRAKYEFAITRGTANEYHSSGNPYVLSGRVGTVDDQESYSGSPGFGVSYFYGDVLGRNSVITNRLRLGLDASMFLGPFTLLGEVSIGTDDDRDVFNAFAEINRVNQAEDFVIYSQLHSLNRESVSGDWQNSVYSTVGFRYSANNVLSISAQYQHGWSGAEYLNTDAVTVQARVRF